MESGHIWLTACDSNIFFNFTMSPGNEVSGRGIGRRGVDEGEGMREEGRGN